MSEPADKPTDATPAKSSTLDDLQARAELAAAEVAVRAAASAALEGAERAGTGLLDALEQAIFGRVGGAEATLQVEKIADPLDRLRAKYGDVKAPTPPPAREDPVAKARAELERLKAAAGAKGQASADAAPAGSGPSADEPVKRTL